MRPHVLAALTIVAFAPAVHAQMASAQAAPAEPAACAAMDQGLPPELAAWGSKQPVVAAKGVSEIDKAVLAQGQAYVATLAPTAQVTYPVRPEKPGAAGSNGGVFAFDVQAAGSYVIALGAGAWIDVLKGDAAQRSVGHGHGPACSTVRKVVTFDLQPGRHLVQISGGAEPTLPILVAAKP